MRGEQCELTSDVAISPVHWAALPIAGVVAGFSSGLLYIGEGLAIAAGLVACLKVSRHPARLISPIRALIPTTVPAALVFWHQGWYVPWFAIDGVILGPCEWNGWPTGSTMRRRTAG